MNVVDQYEFLDDPVTITFVRLRDGDFLEVLDRGDGNLKYDIVTPTQKELELIELANKMGGKGFVHKSC